MISSHNTNCVMLLPQRARSEEYQKEITEGEGFNSCDTYAMAAAIDDTFILESDEVSVTHVFEIPRTSLFEHSPTSYRVVPPGGSDRGTGGETHPRHDGAGLHGAAG